MKISEDVRTTLDLGEVELSLNELMNLRRGATIELARPSELQGLLRVHGVPWASCTVELTAESIKIKVLDILCAPTEEIKNTRKLSAPNFE